MGFNQKNQLLINFSFTPILRNQTPISTKFRAYSSRLLAIFAYQVTNGQKKYFSVLYFFTKLGITIFNKELNKDLKIPDNSPPTLPPSASILSKALVPTNPPPPLPLLPPPSLQQSSTPQASSYALLNESKKQQQPTRSKTSESIAKLLESLSSNKSPLTEPTTDSNNAHIQPFKVTPLQICAHESDQITALKESNTASCHCNFCLLNLAYLNKHCCHTTAPNRIHQVDYIDLNAVKTSSFLRFEHKNLTDSPQSQQTSPDKPQTSIRSSTPQIPTHTTKASKCFDEPIIYIDSVELDESYQTNSNNFAKDMNSFLQKLKSKHRLSLHQETLAKPSPSHDYHVIDEPLTPEEITRAKLSPSNSVESFEFISHAKQLHVDESIKSYEQSWEASVNVLRSRLDLALKEEQEQHLENKAKIINKSGNQGKSCAQCASSFLFNKSTIIPIESITPIRLNCSMRDKKMSALRSQSNSNRKSFHGQACLSELAMMNARGLYDRHQKLYPPKGASFVSQLNRYFPRYLEDNG